MKLATKFVFALAMCTLFSLCAGQEGECTAENPGECANTEEVQSGEPVKVDIDENCPDRGHITRCAGKYLDANKNGKLDRDELDAAIGALPWYGRGIVKILGSTDKMMKKCDIDGDDAISMDYDMVHNSETCLATCFKRKAFKGAFFPNCTL